MTITDIINSIYIKTKTNSVSYPAADMLIAINNAYERTASLIMRADQRWQWDDNNNTDFNIARTNIISGQADYTLATSHLKITRIECAVDSTGLNFQLLTPYDQADETDSLIRLGSLSGVPYRYDELGSSVILDPKPNFNCRLVEEGVAGLILYFQRGPSLFTSGDVSTGTKSPGFNSLYHYLIPLWVSYNFALDNTQPTANGYLTEIMRGEQVLTDDYVGRNNNDHKIITTKKINFI